ncbi:hypothetical protein L207DRAFT_486961 [Hyaloscypha variabilis F]|uniref:Actin-like ATPase domain-containing protein n=1 Tax=Hyaloscypha variabilis (strain UAMH 11265 / GT02V1 / F) TaxID=1149755 RepID=A0A2J6RS66_HYAVF|nr:hypothetical protein L207DRAFT_486961 [Hyaloscypha variabilis F]
MAEHRTTPAQRTRSSFQQRKSSSFLRPVPYGRPISITPAGHVLADPVDTQHFHSRPSPVKKFVVGIDYGTTYTSVSYYAVGTKAPGRPARASDIKTVKDWPDAPYESEEQVPTETWYSPVAIVREPLNENEQFDAPKSNPTSTRILEEEYDIEDVHEIADVGEGSSTPAGAREEGQGATVAEPQSREFFWGYTVSKKRYQKMITRDTNLLIQRPKLMLLGTAYTEGDRRTLRNQITRLVNSGIIRKYGKKREPDVRDIRDVITDFLTKVFQHTKNYLKRREGYFKGCPVEFVITVPTVWTQEASRILQFSVEAAIKATEFGCLKNGSIDNLFLIPEPEAGLTWLLSSTRAIVTGETVISLDAGGGTVDCVAYQLDTHWPLRLGQEVVEPGGDNCGSSYLNELLKTHLLGRLHDETYLEVNGITRKGIVERIAAVEFEREKKDIDIYNNPNSSFCITGLRGSLNKRFDNNVVLLDQEDLDQIFNPILQRVWEVLQTQLDAAKSKGKTVKTVFLLGGFGGSPSLIGALRFALGQYAKNEDMPLVTLIEDANKCKTAVSCGAVLRASNKKDGPKRFAHSSYGFLCKEPYDPRLFTAHLRTTPKSDAHDGDKYVDVINYFMRKANPVHEYPPIRAIHTFPVDGPLLKLLCEELLYVSDTATESHYTLSNQKNKDAQCVGRIITDVTSLRDEGHLDIIYPKPSDTNKLAPHYKVEYALVVFVEGRNLRYEARWPALDHYEASNKRKRDDEAGYVVLETAQVSIASAFQPGTK